MVAVHLCRYEDILPIRSHLDPLTDLVTWLEYYSSVDYVTGLLTERHKVALAPARQRARSVKPHARLAREYVDQALTGPHDVSFLPLYYGMLNLLKVCVLFGPYHARLPSNRRHGASYDGYAKNSQSLLTETVTLHPEGTIPLFYQTITGMRVARRRSVQLSDVYPFLLGVGAEYQIATGKPSRTVSLRFDIENVGDRPHLRCFAAQAPGIAVTAAKQLKALIGFKKNTAGKFMSCPIKEGRPIRSYVRPFLLCQQVNGTPAAMISGSRFLVPEELPIVLAFFHMSSVVRYKPEFLARLKDSKYWPLLSTTRRYSLLQFLMAFWSFTHNKTLMINPAPPLGPAP